MAPPPSIGFPRMMKEPGELRVFLPEFIQSLADRGLEVCVEEGYGSRSGLSFDDYRQANEAVWMGSRREALSQDLVLVLRSPSPEELGMVRRGACLISMLHFPTRPKRVQHLVDLGLNAISLDSIANDVNLRLVENMRAVAWNGLEAAFGVLEERWDGLRRPDGKPMVVLILGAGMVGKHAVEAATKMGNIERANQALEGGLPGVIAQIVGRNVSSDPREMERLIRQADILVDAAQRRHPSKPVVPNAWIAWLPEHAVIADLAVDPYTLDIEPPVMRGVEGVPQGDLDQYVFHPDDPNWDKTVPSSIPSDHRRTTVTCYSWPGIHPEACMRHYAQQLNPLMDPLIEKGYDGLSPDGRYFERAMYRGSLRAWLQSPHYGARSRAEGD